MEVFLLLLIISRCAEVDVLWHILWGCSCSFNLGFISLPYLNVIYSLTFPISRSTETNTQHLLSCIAIL